MSLQKTKINIKGTAMLILEERCFIGKEATILKQEERYFIREIVRLPYICTVSRPGIGEVKCYPDVRTAIINCIQIGYSASEKTMIVPPDASIAQVNWCKTILLGLLRDGILK